MSESSGNSSVSSFSTGTGGASSIASDNADIRALSSLQDGPDVVDDDLDTSNRSVQEAVFSTINLISKNKVMDTSLRLSALRILLEALQLFLVLFNPTWNWQIETDYWAYKAISWLLFKMLWMTNGYKTYISGFYFITASTLCSTATTVWIAVALKGTNAENPWLRRLITGLQLMSVVFCGYWWIGMLDYLAYMFDCNWPSLASGGTVNHRGFPEQNCFAMPHLAHMLVAVVILVVFCWNVALLALGSVELNPMTRNYLASSDPGATIRILITKMILVILCTSLDSLDRVQTVLVLLTSLYLMHVHNGRMPFYEFSVNAAWIGICWGLVFVAAMVTGLDFALGGHADDPTFARRMTMGVLYGIFPTVLWGVSGAWWHQKMTNKLLQPLVDAFAKRQQAMATAVGREDLDAPERLKKVFRFRDNTQVALFCRRMRKWDEDGAPDPDAAGFGEFVIRCGMARMPNDVFLLVLYAAYLLEVKKDGQAARAQLQSAQKNKPGLIGGYTIYATQQLIKELHREDALDMMSYVEFQRNYRSCVRVHKAALLAQRQFWNSLMHDTVQYKDVRKRIALMEATEQRATAIYRRALERYPTNGKLLKVYARFLEYVRHDPWTASRFYSEAAKQGTTQSLVSLARSQGGDNALSKAGNINEKEDGIIVINAFGSMLMLNPAAVSMFGYDKGELEGKNVALLMPAPFSAMHDAFLKRYVDGGDPHIIEHTRAVVALHKDRHIFPISLWVTRLSGIGSETLFIGVVKSTQPEAAGDDRVVRFWTTGSGLVLCADATTADVFGIDPSGLTGITFSSLCTEPEVVDRYLLDVASLGASASGGNEDHIRGGGPKMVTQIQHRYLAPVDVEVTTEFGGAMAKGHDCRMIIVKVRVLSGASAVLAIDQKGRINFATEKLAAVLGYSVPSLTRMELNSLLPQPYCQMHGAWFKDYRARQPGPTSCRAGGVVQFLASNGNKIPVTLKMSVKQDTDKGQLHVVQVNRVEESAFLNQHCLQLAINHEGVILETNTGVPASLYGFNASDVVGKPLASIIDVFGLWRHTYGEDKSLLLLLASRAIQNSSAGTSWRVGVHLPKPDDASILANAEKLVAGQEKKGIAIMESDSLLQALQQRNRLRPACLTAELIHMDDKTMQGLDSAEAMQALPVLKVSLHRADALSSVLELDKHMNITHADEAAGLIISVNPKKLVNQSFLRLAGLPESTTFESLMGQKAAAKKGAMKGAVAGSRTGAVKTVKSTHFGDGKPIVLEMQAMTYQQGGKEHQLVRLQLVDPSSASFPALLQLKQGKGPAAILALDGLEDTPDDASADEQDRGNVSDDAQDHAASDDDDAEGGSQKAGSDSDGRHKALTRISTWVREASQLPDEEDQGYDDEPAAYVTARLKARNPMKAAISSLDGITGKPQGDGPYCTAPDGFGSADGVGAAGPRKQQHMAMGRGSEDYEEPTERKGRQRRNSIGAGSVADSATDGASSIGDAASEAAGGPSAGGQDEDLAVDARRAKRLKKLNRLLQSSSAQFAANDWRIRTLLLLAVMLLAHLVCFLTIMTQINERYSNVNGVNYLAKALDGLMVMLLRANLIQKCWLPTYLGTMWACGNSQMALYLSRLGNDVRKSLTYHHATYLNNAKGFEDPHMLNYWTYKELPEYVFVHDYILENGTIGEHIVQERSNTLWAMGNNMITAGKELYFLVNSRANDPILRQELNESTHWQYIYQNGAKSVFEGYATSMDMFVDYCWQDLLSLASDGVILLVLEVVVVHLSCMMYELWLTQRCNMSHLRIFSVFLALPSATVRQMTQRPLRVDEEDTADADDDDLDLADGAAPAADATASIKPKSVRMVVAGGPDEDVDDDDAGQRRSVIGAVTRKVRSSVAGGFSGKGKSKRGSEKVPLTGFALARKNAWKQLTGWIRPKFSRNGRKLLADSNVVWRFLVPMILWVTAASIVFGVSVHQLQGLDEPIAALDTASHVLYRLARTRVAANLLAFGDGPEDRAINRAFLQQELLLFEQEYRTLLYGGEMLLKVNVSFKPIAPASIFEDESITDLFFRTTACLKADQSTCINNQSDPLYNSVHTGLNTMVNRYIQEMSTFSKLPDALANANHSSYYWVLKVGAADLHDGLETSADLFVKYTISRLEGVKQFHIVLLVISIACLALYILLLYRPYLQQLRKDCKTVAGMLSLLPTEVDVEGHVKTIVFGVTKGSGSASMAGAPGPLAVAGSGGSVVLGRSGGSVTNIPGSNFSAPTASKGPPNINGPTTGNRGSYPGYAVNGLPGYGPGPGPAPPVNGWTRGSYPGNNNQEAGMNGYPGQRGSYPGYGKGMV